MGARKNKKQFNTKAASDGRSAPQSSALSFDAAEFMHFLEGTDWSDEQKAEYITLVWDIVFELVMLGITVKAPDTPQNICGKLSENGSDKGIQSRGMVNLSHDQLIEEFARPNRVEDEPGEKEEDDG